jgi:magnesium transporter
MIRVFRWDGRHAIWGGPESLPRRDDHLPCVWIDLDNPTSEEEQKVLHDLLPVHPLTLEDMTRPRRLPDEPPHLPKVEELPDYLFVVVNPLTAHARGSQASPAAPLAGQLSSALTRTLLVTHHCMPLSCIDALRLHLEKHPSHAERGPDFLFHLILDHMVDEYAPLLDEVDDALGSLEEDVFIRPDASLLHRLMGLKRRIVQVRKTLVHEREVLARMWRGELRLIEPAESVYYRNVYDHLLRFTELIEASRETAMDLMQTLLASQANKLNEVMKVLTMISVTILPMSLIAGVYGMNFEHNVWPDFKESPTGFLIALMMMALSGVGAFSLFKWMKWV